NVALHVIDDTKWFLQLRRRNLSFTPKKNIDAADRQGPYSAEGQVDRSPGPRWLKCWIKLAIPSEFPAVIRPPPD
ncbi:MAG: hypothetical protein WBH10_14010, partial [Allopontixanthobacter sediminis]